MPAPKIDTSAIQQKIQDLEGERANWLTTLKTAQGVQRRLAQTALTQIEARLRWYRGRSTGKKPEAAFTHGGRKTTKARNAARLAEVRP